MYSTIAQARRQAVVRARAATDFIEDDQLRGVAVLRILAVSVISTMKVDWPRARSSLAPMRVKMRSTMPRRALRRERTNPFAP